MNFRHLFIFSLILSNYFSCKKARTDDGSGEVKDVQKLLGLTNDRRSVEAFGVCGDKPGVSETAADAVKRNFKALPEQVQSILAKKGTKLDFETPNIELLDKKALTEKCGDIFINWSAVAANNAPEAVKNSIRDIGKTFEVAKADLDNHNLELNGCWGLKNSSDNDPTKADLVLYVLNDKNLIDQQLLALSFIAFFEYYVDVAYTQERTDKFFAAAAGKEAQISDELLSTFTYFRDVRKLRDSLGEKMVNYLKQINSANQATTLLSYYVKIFRSGTPENLKKNSHFQNYMLAELLDNRHCNLKTNAVLANLRLDVTQTNIAADLDANVGAVVRALDTYLGLPWYAKATASASAK